ncbi:hypothetical protein LTR37_005936 [Vermiconidia calcicola]|uniref:Uncharacterized protein n=1 Tax=Vermiconidia calcicola TaxID=1690605 RepID=A0ACC3NJG5_9PEZI|nr:hypothetical protein LTR37_005936 [Vermiconidia calcicola]
MDPEVVAKWQQNLFGDWSFSTASTTVRGPSEHIGPKNEQLPDIVPSPWGETWESLENAQLVALENAQKSEDAQEKRQAFPTYLQCAKKCVATVLKRVGLSNRRASKEKRHQEREREMILRRLARMR